MELLYKEKTGIIIGILYEVFNELGVGLRERFYEKAIFEETGRRGMVVRKQKVFPIYYKDKELGVRRLDLLFDNEILVELKIGKRLNMKDFQQVNEYLKSLNLKLGLLVLFSPKEVVIRRVVNL